MRYRDIEQFPHANYEVDVSWGYLENQLAGFGEMGLDLDPDFQRGHVWAAAQQIAFVEHMLRGGRSPRHLYFNCAGWRQGRGPIQLIDGKQRLEAARSFLRDELRVFGGYTCADLGGLPPMDPMFRFHVHSLPTRADVLRWYLAMNSGGSIHTEAELDRVRQMLNGLA